MNIQYYLIHGIDKRRKQRVIDLFEKVNIDNSKVKWILHPNKDEIDDIFIKTNVIPGISYSCDLPINAQQDLSKGKVCCTYKHFLCIKDIVENNYEYAVIMEDNHDIADDVPKNCK